MLCCLCCIELLCLFLLVWNVMGVYCDVEFNCVYVFGFFCGVGLKDWFCLYLFVCMLEWYFVFEDECCKMLVDYGCKGVVFMGVFVNMVVLFVFGDYEWLLLMEVDEFIDFVDMMCDLCYIDVCLYVKEEVFFYIGCRFWFDEIVDVF